MQKKPPSQMGQGYEYVRDPSRFGNTPAPVRPAPTERPARPMVLGRESKKVQAAADAALAAKRREMASAGPVGGGRTKTRTQVQAETDKALKAKRREMAIAELASKVRRK